MKKGIYKPAIDKAYTWLCSQLEKEELKPGDRLPPGRDLAKACGVSRMTIQAVIARLKKEGVVHGGPKKRLRVKGPAKKGKAEPAAAPELPKDTVARIKEEIFSDIVTGHYRPETPLPQYKELQKKYRTSHKTVHAALHGLSAEGHLVIDRRAFRVVAHGASSSENKVYLVAFSFDLTKRGFTRGAHDDLLCNQLHIECQQRNLGLAIHKVYMSQSLSAEAEESPPGFHFPADAFAFVLLLDQPYQHIPAIMRALAKTRKPVAIVDELGTWSVRETVPEKSKIRVFPFTSGETAARAIVCTLIQYGHRRFAFI